MVTETPVIDPRSIITPDAFQVSKELLGLPLASPRRRLAAIVVDLVVIGLVTLLTNSFALILGAVVAFLFMRLSFKQAPVEGSAFHRAMRFSLGCFGLFVGAVTALLWLALGTGSNDSRPDVLESLSVPVTTSDAGGGPGEELQLSLGDMAGFLGGGVGLVRAEDPAAAQESMEILVRRGRATGSSDASIREAILEMVPQDRAWSENAEALVDEVLSQAGVSETPAAAPLGPDAGVAGLSTPEALEAYAVLLRSADAGDPRIQALRARLLPDIAGDTLSALENEVGQLQEMAERRLDSNREMEEALQEAQAGGGVFSWLRGILDELGFGFGWASLYMTVVLTWWKGQTLGKKLMGIRVVRLDGLPITWWVAFERAGGYAAGFATGLLGFAQVWWDANGQAIHDRIVGTVVVVDGAEPIGNWEEAL